MDVYDRRKMFLSEEPLTREEIAMLSESKENYGNVEQLVKQDIEGMKIEASYNGEANTYWVPQDGSWMSGRDLWVEKAYRIFEENDEAMEVKEVQGDSERNAIANGIRARIRRILDGK